MNDIVSVLGFLERNLTPMVPKSVGGTGFFRALLTRPATVPAYSPDLDGSVTLFQGGSAGAPRRVTSSPMATVVTVHLVGS